MSIAYLTGKNQSLMIPGFGKDVGDRYSKHFRGGNMYVTILWGHWGENSKC